MIDLAQRSEPCEIALPYSLLATVQPSTMARRADGSLRAIEAIE